MIGVLMAGLIAYFLFAPFYLEINSETSLYRVRFHHLISGSLSVTNYTFILELRFTWTKKRFNLFRKPPEKTERKKKRNTGKWKIPFRKIRAILGTFKVTRLDCSIDTGESSANGFLFPFFYWLSRSSGRSFRVNFLGENQIILEVKNNLARMIGMYIIS